MERIEPETERIEPEEGDDSTSRSARTSPDDQVLLEAVGGGGEGFWQDVVDTMHEGLLLVGPDRRIVYLNKRAEEIVGRSLGEVRGALCIEAINCPQCDCRCRLFQDGGADNVEVSIYDPDGHHRVLLKNARVLRDAQGDVLGGVETFSDITNEVNQRSDTERYTEMLYRDKCRIDALLDALDDGVLAVDDDFRVLMCASRTAEFLGLSGPGEAVGRALEELIDLDGDAFGESKATALDGRSFRIELGQGAARRPASVSFRRVRPANDEMLVVIRPLDRSRGRARNRDQTNVFHGIVSQSPRMREIFDLIENAGQTDANILIEGETGVGKELVARAIHQLSPRREEPIYAFNCATFTGSLLLSELFGHERGSFTGAYRTTKGKLELAGGGTLFLDEVSEIPLHYQALLLRVLEDRHFERVGGRDKVALRARIIAATNEQLSEAVRTRRFRHDLYFRLKVVPIHVPPLRERREDIQLLVEHFAKPSGATRDGHPVYFGDEVLRVFSQYRWPGNVRELRNMVEYLCFIADDEVRLEHLPPEFGQLSAGPSVGAAGDADADERTTVLAALEKSRYRKKEAAEVLGIDRTTLWRKMKRLDISG